jgi:transcription termination factor Rho
MDPKSQERLQALLAVDPVNWSDDDTAFVRARSGYLTPEQRERLKLAAPQN